MRTTMTVFLCRFVIILGWILILAGLAVVSVECVSWLRNGTWMRWPLRDMVTAVPEMRRYDPNDWMPMRGVDRLVAWIGSIPTSLVLLAAGMGLAWNANDALVRIEAQLEEIRRRTHRV